MSPTAKRTLATVTVIGLAVVAAIFWLGRSGEPRYRGRPASFYFPTWVTPAAAANGTFNRFPADRDPAGVRFLVDAILWYEGRNPGLVYIVWEKLGERLPRVMASLPIPTAPVDRLEMAYERLADLATTEPGQQALQGQLRRLPDRFQGRLLAAWRQASGRASNLQPLIEEALRHGNPQVRWAGALAALRLTNITAVCLPAVLRHLESAATEPVYERYRVWDPCLRSLGDLGAAATPALPLLDRLSSDTNIVGMMARLTAMRVREHAPDFQGFFEGEARAGRIQSPREFLEVVWPTWEGRANRSSFAAATEQALPLLTNLLSPGYVTNCFRGQTWTGSQLPLQGRVINMVEQLGERGRPAYLAIANLLQDPHSMSRLQAARALGRLGAVAPETLPQLVEAMKDPALQETLIPLLGAYGPAASNALPDLRALAAGEWRTSWTNTATIADRGEQFATLDPALARRYGLKLEASSHSATVRLDPVLAKRYGLQVEERRAGKVYSRGQLGAQRAVRQILGHPQAPIVPEPARDE